jgi:hypothetical protein
MSDNAVDVPEQYRAPVAEENDGRHISRGASQNGADRYRVPVPGKPDCHRVFDGGFEGALHFVSLSGIVVILCSVVWISLHRKPADGDLRSGSPYFGTVPAFI